VLFNLFKNIKKDILNIYFVLNHLLFRNNRVISFIISIISVLYISSYILSPFLNADPAFYTIIGRSYLREGIIPYNYIFDHKPAFIYVFYGIWDFLFPFNNGKFAILAILLSTIFVFSCSMFGEYNKILAALILLIIGAPFDPLSGNSEIVLISLESVCFLFIKTGIRNNKSKYYIFSGVLSSIVININYLSAICLFAPMIILIFFDGIFSFKRIIYFMIGNIIGIIIVFIPLIVAGNNSVESYFYLQSNYMKHYSGSYSDRVYSIFLESAYALASLPIIISWIKKKLYNFNSLQIENLVLPAWAVSSFIATLLSGHPFSHYFLLCFSPVSIMMAILINDKNKINVYYIYFIISVSSLFMINESRQNLRTYFYNKEIDFAKIDNEIKNNSVLSIRAYHTLFYFSHIKTLDKYLFHDHIDIVYGKNANEHFISDLEKNPKYVVTEYKACDIHSISDSICEIIYKRYNVFYEKSVRKNKYNRFSITIYKLR